MSDERTRIQHNATEEAQRVAKETRIDLDAFLALHGADRAARWRQWPTSAKQDAVIQMLGRLGYDYDQATLDHWVAEYDQRYGASDLAIPAASDILEAAKERSETAQQYQDYAGAAQLDRVRMNILSGARLAWHLGDLLVNSVNTPGLVYSVSRRGCTCPNGQAGKASCWHVALFDLLLDMQQTAADTADMEAERLAARQLGRRLCAARSRVISEAA